MRPAQSRMFGARLAEAQALLYGPNDGPARDAQVERWLADVERGFQPAPQLPLPLPTSRGTRPAPLDRSTTLCEQGRGQAVPGDRFSLDAPLAGNGTRASCVVSKEINNLTREMAGARTEGVLSGGGDN